MFFFWGGGHFPSTIVAFPIALPESSFNPNVSFGRVRFPNVGTVRTHDLDEVQSDGLTTHGTASCRFFEMNMLNTIGPQSRSFTWLNQNRIFYSGRRWSVSKERRRMLYYGTDSEKSQRIRWSSWLRYGYRIYKSLLKVPKAPYKFALPFSLR
jgi:hypothetical protein